MSPPVRRAWSIDFPTEGVPLPTYEIVYGDDEHVVRERLENVVIEQEDGWTVFFRGKDVILRVQDAHLQSLQIVQ